ncbi:MAG: hypothetical protein WBX14_14020 [Candidatus Udaeobacter sp.]
MSCGIVVPSGNAYPPLSILSVLSSKPLEEICVYIDMPARSFGLQLVYTEEINPAEMEVVRESDAVLCRRVTTRMFRESRAGRIASWWTGSGEWCR